jgi:hypothetical protein
MHRGATITWILRVSSALAHEPDELGRAVTAAMSENGQRRVSLAFRSVFLRSVMHPHRATSPV